MNIRRSFLHIDMDAFFASIEQHDHPEWKGKPVIVSGDPHATRSVVSTASYEARVFGIHSAMPSGKALQLCPHGIFTPCRMDRYSEISEQIIELLHNYSPTVEQYSIDEACIDLTGSEQLFGAPEDTAKKIKEDIFNKTGLTVSVGLASSRYLAKLASEINKPNGFFQIPFEKEEEFLQSLPLNKIWGIGKKTLEKLNNIGIFTTKQLYQKDINILQLIFGKATGTFLYNTIHAKENGYREIPVSHSISSETTFNYDLIDRYTIETEILQLCENIIFRLLSKKVTSKTIMLKIRYEDFSTFSIQETTEDYITSLDDIFSRVKNLFEKKYEFPKGIRLLGISVEHIEETKNISQKTLFDFGEAKKQAVENAILNIKTKHPELKIKKARLLNTNKTIKSFFPLVILFSLFFTNKLNSQENINSITSSNAGSIQQVKEFDIISSDTNEYLFNYNINNKNLKLFIKGWWQAALEGTLNTSYTSENGFTFSPSLPIFKQEIDLSLLLKLNDTWYLKTEFADQFNKNTISLGYDKDFSKFLLSNRGITFPTYYSAQELGFNIGGGENQSPGFYTHFEDTLQNKWKADLSLRYNFTKQKEATFYGKNSVTEAELNINEYVIGKAFTIPHSLIQNIKEIYVESKTGTYTDKYGIKYKKLSPSEYLLLLEKNQIYFSKTAGTTKTNNKIPSILIEFNSEINFISEIGSFDDKNTFLGKIQDYFGSESDTKPKLSNYSYDFSVQMNNKQMLLIQSGTGFSPFLCANQYDLGQDSNCDVKIINKYSSTQNEEYDITIETNEIDFVSEDFFEEKQYFAKIFSKNQENNFPLANKYPEYYLDLFPKTDLIISVKKYTPVSRYEIGTNIAENSVKVYKNGILDSNAKYDKESGIISLSSTVSSFDKIYVTWQEDTTDAKNGSISGAAGFLYNFTQKLYSDVAITTYWPISPYLKFTDESTSAFGFISLTSGITYKTEHITISDKIALSFESNNTTGIYRILGMDWDIPNTNYIGKSAGYIVPPNISPILTDRTSINSQIQLHPEQNFTIYDGTQTDSQITGYKIPISWEFPKNQTNCWAGISINLQEKKELLSAQEFHISLKNEKINNNTDYDVYLQLGVQADNDIDYEESQYIPTWKISDEIEQDIINSFDKTKEGWQIVKIKIQENDLIRFTQNQNARIIIYEKNTSTENTKGTISIGPYEIITQSFFIKENPDIEILSKQKKDNSIKKYDTYVIDDNYVEEFSWKTLNETLSEENQYISAYKYFEEVNIDSYKTLNFYFKYVPNKNETKETESNNYPFIKILLDRNYDTISHGKTLELEIYDNQILNNSSWNKISIDLINSQLYINDCKIANNYKLHINKTILPTRFLISTSVKNQELLYEEGSFYIDELTLEETSPYFNLKNRIDFSAEKKGTIIQIKNYPLLENVNFQITSTQNKTINTSQEIENSHNIYSIINANVTIAKTNFSTSINFDTSSNQILKLANHTINSQQPFLKTIYISESFLINETDSYLEKYNQIKIDLNKIKIPIQLTSEGSLSNNNWKNEQKNKTDLNVNFNIKNWNIIFNSNIELNQNITNPQGNNYNTTEYFKLWNNSFIETYSCGNEKSSNRNIKSNTLLKISIPYFNFNPELILQASGKYNNTNYANFNDSTAFSMKFPFKIKQNNFELLWKKQGGEQNIINQGGNFFDDIEQIYKNNISKKWFLQIFPFYDIFNNNELQYKIHNNNNNELQYYSSEYKFNWKRPIFANIYDLWIPSTLSFYYTNDIRTAENTTDTQQIKFTLTNTPFNLFGTQSDLKIFNWYQTEEVITSCTSIIKIPKNSQIIYEFSMYSQINFYLNNTDTLNTAFQVQFETNNNWQTQGTLLWKRQGVSSLLTSVVDLFIKEETNHNITRFNSFDFLLKYDNEENNYIQN